MSEHRSDDGGTALEESFASGEVLPLPCGHEPVTGFAAEVTVADPTAAGDARVDVEAVPIEQGDRAACGVPGCEYHRDRVERLVRRRAAWHAGSH